MIHSNGLTIMSNNYEVFCLVQLKQLHSQYYESVF